MTHESGTHKAREAVGHERGQGYRWHAAIARDLAQHCQSDHARDALQEMARRYDRLAAFAEQPAAPPPDRIAAVDPRVVALPARRMPKARATH